MKMFWWIVTACVAVFAACLYWAFGRTDGHPLKTLRTELDAIATGRRVLKIRTALGIEQAREAVKALHKAQLEALDERQKVKVRELESDPTALARFLVRVGRGA